MAGNIGFAGIGGIIQYTSKEASIISFSGPAGCCLVNSMEILALRTGLSEAFWSLLLFGQVM